MPKILIADDEWLTRLEIEEMLTDLGYDVAGQAETGAEAVAMARELNPDLVLMDIEMPGEMNGMDAAREIKAELGTPIVFISGHGDPEYIEAAKDIAAFGYVMKPFDEKEVHAFVEIALSRRKLELKLEESHELLEQTNLDLQEEIAARKNTEMALRESEEKYSKFFHSNPQWLHISTLEDGLFVEANKATKKTTGYEPGELIGRTSKELGFWADYEERSRLVKVAEEQGGFREQEVVLIKKNGEPMSMLWSAAIIEIMGSAYFINSLADITRLKRAEEALRVSEEKYRNILESIGEGYYEVDLAGNFTFFNDAICRIRGCSRDELMGMNNRGYMDPVTAKKVFEAYNQVYTTGKAMKGYEWEIIRKDGTKGYVEVSASLMKNSEDRPIGFRGIVRDVSERKWLHKGFVLGAG